MVVTVAPMRRGTDGLRNSREGTGPEAKPGRQLLPRVSQGRSIAHCFLVREPEHGAPQAPHPRAMPTNLLVGQCPRLETHRHVPKVQAAGTAFSSRTPQGPRNTLLWPPHGRYRWLSPRRKTTGNSVPFLSLASKPARASPSQLRGPAAMPRTAVEVLGAWRLKPVGAPLLAGPHTQPFGCRAEPESRIPVTSPRSPGPCPPSGIFPTME